MAKTMFEQTGGAYSMRGDYCLLNMTLLCGYYFLNKDINLFLIFVSLGTSLTP